MRHIFGIFATLLFGACASPTRNPATDEPTRTVNLNYSRKNVSYYEVYKFPRQSDYHTQGYKVAFVHMKDGGAYPILCMPYSNGIRPSVSVGVKANRGNDAWKVSCWLRRKRDDVWVLVEAYFFRHDGALFFYGGRRLKAAPPVELID